MMVILAKDMGRRSMSNLHMEEAAVAAVAVVEEVMDMVVVDVAAVVAAHPLPLEADMRVILEKILTKVIRIREDIVDLHISKVLQNGVDIHKAPQNGMDTMEIITNL